VLTSAQPPGETSNAWPPSSEMEAAIGPRRSGALASAAIGGSPSSASSRDQPSSASGAAAARRAGRSGGASSPAALPAQAQTAPPASTPLSASSSSSARTLASDASDALLPQAPLAERTGAESSAGAGAQRSASSGPRGSSEPRSTRVISSPGPRNKKMPAAAQAASRQSPVAPTQPASAHSEPAGTGRQACATHSPESPSHTRRTPSAHALACVRRARGRLSVLAMPSAAAEHARTRLSHVSASRPDSGTRATTGRSAWPSRHATGVRRGAAPSGCSRAQRSSTPSSPPVQTDGGRASDAQQRATCSAGARTGSSATSSSSIC